MGEIEELRDHTVKQFRLSDGSYAAVNYGIPVHYLNDSNQWADVDNTLMVICSYVPFTSPMAMFTRIAMSVVPWYEITASIAILIGSTVGIGVLSAKIYRAGVLMYGTTPKIGDILKTIRKA